MNDLDQKLIRVEELLRSLSEYERVGLDTSSLKVFIKNLKTFSKLQKVSALNQSEHMTFSEKLIIIKSFLEDKKLFPKISDVIKFANEELSLDFKDQKESRSVTIRRVIGRIEETPELKEMVKSAVNRLRNQAIHGRPNTSKSSKKDMERIETYARWAEILMKL
jgi:hypothetical protein